MHCRRRLNWNLARFRTQRRNERNEDVGNWRGRASSNWNRDTVDPCRILRVQRVFVTHVNSRFAIGRIGRVRIPCQDNLPVARLGDDAARRTRYGTAAADSQHVGKLLPLLLGGAAPWHVAEWQITYLARFQRVFLLNKSCHNLRPGSGEGCLTPLSAHPRNDLSVESGHKRSCFPQILRDYGI